MTDQHSPRLDEFYKRLRFEHTLGTIDDATFRHGEIVGRYIHVLDNVDQPTPAVEQAAHDAAGLFHAMGGASILKGIQ